MRASPGCKMCLASLVLALSVLAMPLAAETQEYKTGKLPQLGWLSLGSRLAHVATFRQGLREHGWVEGQSIRPIEFRWAEGNADRLPDLAAELVLLKSDVIIAPGAAAAAVAARITKTIPIIMFATGDPVANRIVASLARPGGNVTGLASISSALSGKRLQLLSEAIPRAKRIAVLVNPANPSHPVALHGAEDAARRLGGLQLEVVEYRGRDDLVAAFQAARRKHADGLIALDDSVTFSYRATIAELAAKNRLPALHGFREAAEAGGLMAYGADQVDQSRRAASYVDKVLRGAKPADLPIEQPTKFEFVINLKAAKDLGLTIPRSLLLQADQVIE